MKCRGSNYSVFQTGTEVLVVLDDEPVQEGLVLETWYESEVEVVSNNGSHLDEQLDKIVNFIVNDGRFYVGKIGRETFTSDDEIIR